MLQFCHLHISVLSCSLWPHAHKMATTVPSITESRGRKGNLFYLEQITHFSESLQQTFFPSCLMNYNFKMYTPGLNQLLARGIGVCTKLDKIYQELSLSHGGKSRYLHGIRTPIAKKRKGEGRWFLRRQPKESTITGDWITARKHNWNGFGIIQNICKSFNFYMFSLLLFSMHFFIFQELYRSQT